MKTMPRRDYANDRLAGFNESRERENKAQVGGGRVYAHAGFKAQKVELDLNFQIGEKYVFRDLRVVEVKYVGFPERGLPGFGKTKVVGMEIIDDPTGFGGKNDGSVQYSSGKVVQFFKASNPRMGLFMKAHDFHGKCLTTLDDYLDQKDSYLAQLDGEKVALKRQKTAEEDRQVARQKSQLEDVFARQEKANSRKQLVRGDQDDERAAFRARQAATAGQTKQRVAGSQVDDELPEGWHNMSRREQKHWRRAQKQKAAAQESDSDEEAAPASVFNRAHPNPSRRAPAPKATPAKKEVELPSDWMYMSGKQKRRWKKANNYDSDSD